MLDSTTAVQDYVKAIYQLGGHEGGVPTSALAERLGVTPASVSAMVKRLDEMGLAQHTRYQGVRLTEAGLSGALEVIRHHRLLELYLAKVVGMPLDKVHAEAEVLEHVLSEELEARLDELLGHPTEDPHGHPIPGPDLTLEVVDHPQLADVTGECIVRSVSDRSPELLRHLDALGLRPGARLVVLDAVPFGGGVRIRVGPEEHVVGAEAAKAVTVTSA
jgi:DtxR family Mn-dependent transcriptional regulator